MTYFLLGNNTLYVFSKTVQLSLSFPQEVVHFQEITDRKAFEALVKNFFAKAGGGEGIFFLSDEIVYEKSKENSAITKIDDEARLFFEKIPFQQDFLAKKVVRLKKQTFFFATHRDYFKTITHIAKTFGWDIKQVVPLALFHSLTSGKQMSYNLLGSIVKNKQILEAADFFQEYTLHEEKNFTDSSQNGIPTEEFMDAKPSMKLPVQYIIAAISLLCFVAAIFYAYPVFFPATPKKLPVKVLPTITPKPTITTTPVSSPSAKLDKSDITIEVLNGSGIAGQATIIKNSLIDAGFIKIDTGNTEGETVSQSKVVFSSSVSLSFQEEIMQKLKKSLAAIDMQQVATSDAYDVVITTGNPAQ